MTEPTKIYRGWRDDDGTCHITVRHVGKPERALDPRLDLSNHSPSGFAWGFGGSGPAQTALAVVADAIGDDARALRFHQMMKWTWVAKLHPEITWEISDETIRDMVERLERRWKIRA